LQNYKLKIAHCRYFEKYFKKHLPRFHVPFCPSHVTLFVYLLYLCSSLDIS